MNEKSNDVLLPDGLRDVLPPDAGHEASIARQLVDSFATFGYDRVAPPLVEFEDTLLQGAATSLATDTFRLMDPVSQRMMGVRADMTLQVARIATSRLRNQTRPLRLAYAGPVLRVKGTQLRPEREFVQAGAELIGSLEPAGDAEAILLAAKTLEAVGVQDVSIDINLPPLVPAICSAHNLNAVEMEKIRAALDLKDIAAVENIGGPAVSTLKVLLAASGPAGEALEAINNLELPETAALEQKRLNAVIQILSELAPDLSLTVDFVEHRGFEYHTGLSFTIFAKGVRGEIGRGGRYRAGKLEEPSTGFSLFMDSILRALPSPPPIQRVYVPFESALKEADGLRANGMSAFQGLVPTDNPRQTAKLHGCSHVLVDGKVEKL